MLLELDRLTLRRGALEVARDVSIGVSAGEVVSIIGTNGAGKSSLMLSIAGLLAPVSGSMRFDGQDITRLPSHRRSHLGIALAPEGRWLFAQMTVEENLRLGAFHRPRRDQLADRLAYVFDLFPKLRDRRTQITASLSGGEQQMVAIGRALMGSPRLLMLDEPSIGLAPTVVADIFQVVARIAREGLTTLIVEQNVEDVLRLSSRGYVLQNGVVALEGAADMLLKNPEVAAVYLGHQPAAACGSNGR
jgi:branched-chain amino acid transport system ATP-binding protein